MRRCPSLHDLERLLAEELSESEKQALASHVERCLSCQRRLADLTADPEASAWQELLTSQDFSSGTGSGERLANLQQPSATLISDESAPDAEFLARLAETPPEEAALDLRTDTQVDVIGYEILGVLGQGGMSVVYKAREKGLNRLVALKVILAGAHASPERRDRFRAEADSVARLQHPNIVQIYGVFQHDGMPFLSLEYVNGGTLAENIRGTPIPPGDAARLSETLARAMDHAHERGVIHRDLKPANVLMSGEWRVASGEQKANQLGPKAFDSLATRDAPLATPKITDFGLAKRLDEESGQTHTGQILGTPSYMAPEQADGRNRAIGPATDVYSLGAILYELLTGRPPFKAATATETVLLVLHEEPVSLSRLVRQVPRELETICLKCLQKEPHQRYASARELADDLARYLAGEPIRAQPASTLERAVKWARRRPALATLCLVSIVAILALGGVITGTAYNTWLRQALEETRKAREVAEGSQAAEAVARKQAEQFRYYHHVALAHSGWHDGQTAHAVRLLEDCPPSQRGWEWNYLQRLVSQDCLATLEPEDLQGVHTAAFSPDGKRLAIGNRDGSITLWNAVTESRILTLRGHENSVSSLAFSPGPSTPGLLASASWDRTVRVWDANTGQIRLVIAVEGDQPNSVAYSPDGRRLTSASGDKKTPIKIWDAVTGARQLTLKGRSDTYHSAMFSPDGSRLVAAGGDGSLCIWNAVTGEELTTLRGHTNWARAVAYSPDGSRLASGSWDRTVRIWDAQSGSSLLTLTGHTAPIDTVAFSPDGAWVATGSSDQLVRIWDASTGREIGTLKHGSTVWKVTFSSDGTRLATAGGMNAKLWSAVAGRGTRTLRGHNDKVWSVAFSPDGTRLASGSWDGTVRIWDPRTGQEQHSYRHQSIEASGSASLRSIAVWGIAFSPNGRWLASGGQDQAVQIFDAYSGKNVVTLRGHRSAVFCVAFSPNGKWLASAGEDGTVLVWNLELGELNFPPRRLEGHHNQIYGLAFSPDSLRLVSGDADCVGKVWEVATGRELQSFRGPHALVIAGYNSEGTQFLTCGPGPMRIWDATSCSIARTFPGHTALNTGGAFCPNTNGPGRIATVGADGMVRIWDAASGQEVLTLRGHTERVQGVAFSPDGTQLATASYDGTVRVWDARPWSREARTEQEALNLLDYLFELPLARTDVLEHLRNSPTLNPYVRAMAMASLSSYRQETNPSAYYQAGWVKLRKNYLGGSLYRIALQQVETASRLAPGKCKYLIPVAVGLYRVGRKQEARQALEVARTAWRKEMPKEREDIQGMLAEAEAIVGAAAR